MCAIVRKVLHRQPWMQPIGHPRVNGQRHVCMWGLLRNLDKGVRFTLDFGQGGKAAALVLHVCIVRQKISASYALQRSAYKKLVNDVPFSQPTSIQ